MADFGGGLSSGIAQGMLAQQQNRRADADLALKMFAQLSETPEEQQPALQAAFQAAYPHIQLGNVPPIATQEFDIPGVGKQQLRRGEVVKYAPFFQMANQRDIAQIRTEAAQAIQEARAATQTTLATQNADLRRELQEKHDKIWETLRRMDDASRNQRADDMNELRRTLAEDRRDLQLTIEKIRSTDRNRALDVRLNIHNTPISPGSTQPVTPVEGNPWSLEVTTDRKGKKSAMWVNRVTKEVIEPGAFREAAKTDADMQAALQRNVPAARGPGAGMSAEQIRAQAQVLDRQMQVIQGQIAVERDPVQKAALTNRRNSLAQQIAQLGATHRQIVQQGQTQPQPPRGAAPSSRATQVLGIWAQSRAKVPAAHWGTLTADEQTWLTQQGVQHE